MSELPKGWCWATINDTGEYINGYPFKPSDWSSDGKPIIRIQNLTNPGKPLNRTTAEPPENIHVNPGDLLVSWSATLDAFIWGREPAYLNQHIFKVVPNASLIHARLLYHWLRISIEQLTESEHLHGSTMKHINRGPFLAHRIPVPPANEQSRLVDKLEELLSDLDAGVAELKAAQAKLAQYRQSLLKAAVDGSLTAEWRKTHTPQESGAQLLERILDERRKRWETKQLAKFQEQGKTPPKGWQNQYPHPVRPDTTNLPELPAGWAWATVDQILSEIRSGSSETSGRAETLFPVLKSSAVRQGSIDFHALNYYEESQIRVENFLEVGDILITRLSGSVDYVGCCATVKSMPEIRPQYPDRIFCGKLSPSFQWLDDFVVLCFASTRVRSIIEAAAKSTAGHKRISLSDLYPLSLPLPPAEEIREIFSKTLGALSEAKHCIDSCDLGLKQAAAQRKNLLKAAFSGQLVPQDPNDEPASVLLERIRAERAAQGGTGARRGWKAKTEAV